MLPFYYLSVTTNLIMGLILVLLDKNGDQYNEKYPFLQDPVFLLVLVIFSGIAAVFKLISPVGGGIPIIGDIIPSLTGAAGTVVFFERWLKASNPGADVPAIFEKVAPFRDLIGYICLGGGVLHLFISPIIFF